MARAEKHKGEVDLKIGEVVLRFLEGENEGVEIRVSPPRTMVMGRSEACDIFLAEKKISRKHCELEVTDSEVIIRDFQSTNSTYLNGKKVTENKVKNDDKIRVGNSVIQVTIHTEKSIKAAEEEPATRALEEPEIKFEPTEEKPVLPMALEDNDEPSGVMDLASDESFSSSFGPMSSPSSVGPLEIPEPVSDRKPKTLSGNLSAMGLADLLQNLSQNQKSGVLRLSSVQEGKIILQDGKLLSAAVGGVTGSKAMYRMLGWNEGEFELLPLPKNFGEKEIEDPIKDSIERLLMEGFRQYDELEKIKKGLPPYSVQLSIKPKFTAPLSKLHPRVLDVFQIVLNEGVFQTVLDKSPHSDLETAKIVFYLLKKEYLVAK